jgi:hypothetical protein
MTRAILIEFDTKPDENDLNFKIWIFAEDLYRALKSHELASLSLDEVDRVSSRLIVPVRSKRRVRRTSAAIEQLLQTHFLAPFARLSVIDEHGQIVA